MSRPTTAEHRKIEADLIKSTSALAEISLLTDAVNQAITREIGRFGQNSYVNGQLMEAFSALLNARTAAEVRSRESRS